MKTEGLGQGEGHFGHLGAKWTLVGSLRSLSLLVLLVAALFVAAGTLDYWQGWLFFFVFVTATIWLTVDLIKRDPALLQRRIKAGPTAEKRPVQQFVMLSIILANIALLVVAGLDERFGWSHLPGAVALIGDAMIVLGYAIFHLVFKENSFASSTIEISEGQRVISTGPYSIVRHPMYVGAMIFSLGIPLALGSFWATLVLIPVAPILMLRILDEEKFLRESLDGYAEYCTRVRYRLIPGVY